MENKNTMKGMVDVLKKKVSEIRSTESFVTTKKNTSLFDVLKEMRTKKVSCAVILDDEQQVIGLFTGDLLATRLWCEDANFLEQPVTQFVHQNPFCLESDQPAKRAFMLMRGAAKHVVVVENKKLKGVLSLNDMADFLMDEEVFL